MGCEKYSGRRRVWELVNGESKVEGQGLETKIAKKKSVLNEIVKRMESKTC